MVYWLIFFSRDNLTFSSSDFESDDEDEEEFLIDQEMVMKLQAKFEDKANL